MTNSPKVFIVDFLVVIATFFLIISLLESPAKPTVQTYGVMAITTSWQNESDVDLYVRDPLGKIVYFASPSTGLMYLEHDTIPLATDYADGHKTVVKGEHERVVITGVIPGEYTVDVMLYHKVGKGSVVVTVQVWSLQGQDRVLLTKYMVLKYEGQDTTAFRITLDQSGRIIRTSTVQANLVGGALQAGVPSISSSPAPDRQFP